MIRKLLAAVAAFALGVLLSGCGVSTPSDYALIQIGDGGVEDKKPKGCVAPGTTNNSPTNDKYIAIPVNERDYERTGEEGSDGNAYRVASGVDQLAPDEETGETISTGTPVPLKVPVTIRFKIIAPASDEDEARCETATEFYLEYLRRYNIAWDTDTGDVVMASDTDKKSEDWTKVVLRKLMGEPTQQTLEQIMSDFNYRDASYKPEVREEVQERLNGQSDDPKHEDDNILELIDTAAKGTYFDDVVVVVGDIEPWDDDLANTIADEQKALATIRTEKERALAEAESRAAQAESDALAAEAELRKKKAESANLQAEIRAYQLPGMTPEESVRAYNEAQCLAKANCNPWHPEVWFGGMNPTIPENPANN